MAMTTTTKPKLWVPGDWNAFFGFGTNILVNMLVLTGLLRFVLKMPDELVFGRILPATGLMLLLSTLYYAWLAYKLAGETGRTDVCALPSGISVPHMFVVVFVVMLPILIATRDPIQAWEAGLTWVFVQSFVLMAGGFIAPVIRRITPRAALLGSLAGISITFIAMRPGAQMAMTPVIGLVCFAVILVDWFGGVRWFKGVPGGLVAIVVGAVIAWGSTLFGFNFGGLTVAGVKAAVSSFGFSYPMPAVAETFGGFKYIGVILVTAIPFGIYDLVEAMDNVESAAAAGDSFPTTRVLTADGVVSLIGCLMGNPFINAVYIGHPGWKAMGGRIGYSAATGLMVIVLAWFGIIAVLLAFIPVVAISPILLYIGMLIGAQAYQTTPARHAHAASCRVVQDPDGRRARRRRHQRGGHRHGEARRRRRALSRPRSAGRRRDPHRPRARRDRGVRDRAQVHGSLRFRRGRRRADLLRLHARGVDWFRRNPDRGGGLRHRGGLPLCAGPLS